LLFDPSSVGEHDNMIKTTPEQNKTLVLQAFDTLFNKRDYKAAKRYWSSNYIQLHQFSGLGTCRRVAGWIQKHHAASAHAESLNPSPT